MEVAVTMDSPRAGWVSWRQPAVAPRLLVLGGTPQAERLIAILEARFGPRLELLVLEPGDPAARATLGDAQGLGRYLKTRQVGIVIDAMHPLARALRRVAVAAARAAFAPLLALRRPPWPRDPRDQWTQVGDCAAACDIVRRRARRVMLTVEADDLGAFAGLGDRFFLVRVAAPPARFPLASGEFIHAQGPFRIEDEIALLERARIDMLVTRAGGGRSSYARIVAARRLGIPVVIVRDAEPGAPPAEDSPLAASAWVARLLAPAAGGA
jgi:precorrin-6A/cobalt-precorrin-6A reductase